jgi:Flp pilus assembly CpaF family ATPase
VRHPDLGTWGSPLLEVKPAVQERAKALAIEMSRPDGRAALRALLDEEIRRWAEDVKRVTRAYDPDPAGVAERAWRNLAGYGPLEPLLADPAVCEIMISAPEGTF